MNFEFSDRIWKCDICSTYQNKLVKQPIHQHCVPEQPYTKVGVDIYHYKNKEYLIIVDYYSNFAEIIHIKQSTALQ